MKHFLVLLGASLSIALMMSGISNASVTADQTNENAREMITKTVYGGNFEISCPIGVVCDENYIYRAYSYHGDEIYLYLAFNPAVIDNYTLQGFIDNFIVANVHIYFPDRSTYSTKVSYQHLPAINEIKFTSYKAGLLAGEFNFNMDYIVTQIEDEDNLDCISEGDIQGYCYEQEEANFEYTIKFELFIPHGYFEDVPADHDYLSAIEYVYSKGIVQGYYDGTYKPDKTINRAELIKIVIETQFSKERIDNCQWNKQVFPDVLPDQWFAKYICVATDEGIVHGYPDGTFRPGRDVNFVEAAKIILSAFGYSPGSVPAYVSHPDEVFLWYVPFVGGLSGRNAIPLTVATISNNDFTRGETAEVIYRLKENITNKPSMHYYGAMLYSYSSIDNVFDRYCTAKDDESTSFSCLGPFDEFSCDGFSIVLSDVLNLEPAYPILSCGKEELLDKQTSEGVVRTSGVGWQYDMIYITDYVIFRNGAFELLKSEEEFKNTYAPITSKEEALSYLSALHKGDFIDDVEPLKSFGYGSYIVPKSDIITSSVQENDKGFSVKLYSGYSGDFCDDEIYEKTFLVRKTGEIVESSKLIWETDDMHRCYY